VTEIFGAFWAKSASLLRHDPEAAKAFLPENRTPRVGEIFRNPDLAASYEQIAQEGAAAVYKGPIARKILAASERTGGTMTADDLAQFTPEWVEPISTTYRGWTVYELPPNEQGIAALMMLNIVEGFPLGQWGHNSTRTLHAMIEAKKLAYADMLRYDADPKFAKIPTAGLLSKDYARERAGLIDPAKANCSVGPGTPPHAGADTTYLSVTDRDGNMVSLIQSNFALFGSGVAADGGGFVLQNRGGLFTLDARHPNVLAGRKRPVHTIIPAFMQKGDTRIAFGIMGGWNQAQAHAQFVSNVADFGMNIQAALEAARFTKATFAGCDVQLEARVPPEVRRELTALGHQIQVQDDFSNAMGSGQAVLRDVANRMNYGASDARKDGQAVAELHAAR
jgi:gamma-glutamyltranspeptidase/glutathione hydrolase